MTQIPTENGLKCRKEKIENFYDIKEELGRGQFAVVKKCISKETNEEVAAKFIKLKRTRTSKAGLSREMIEREASILNLLSHDKVIKLYDVFDLGPEIVLVLELLSGGELFDKICELEYLTELDACCYMKQVLEAIEHLHDSSIVHLDIKPENIVLKSSDKTDIKLVDFGLAQKLEPGKDLREMMGTPEFVAPEVINYETIGFYTDMWAIGVLAYILLSGCSPFLGDDNQETYANIVEVDYHFDEEYFDKISDDAKLFVSELLIKRPSKRSTVKDCLTHPWLLTISGPRKRQDSSIIATGRFKAFVARRRWQQSFQKLNAITRFSKFLRKGVLPTFPEESVSPSASPCVSPGPEDTTFTPISTPSSTDTPKGNTPTPDNEEEINQHAENKEPSDVVDCSQSTTQCENKGIGNVCEQIQQSADGNITIENDEMQNRKMNNSKNNLTDCVNQRVINKTENSVGNTDLIEIEEASSRPSNTNILPANPDKAIVNLTSEENKLDNASKQEISHNESKKEKDNVVLRSDSTSDENVVNVNTAVSEVKDVKDETNHPVPSIEIRVNDFGSKASTDEINAPVTESPSRLRKESHHRKYSREAPVHYTQMFLDERRRQMMKEGSFASVDEASIEINAAQESKAPNCSVEVKGVSEDIDENNDIVCNTQPIITEDEKSTTSHGITSDSPSKANEKAKKFEENIDQSFAVETEVAQNNPSEVVLDDCTKNEKESLTSINQSSVIETDQGASVPQKNVSFCKNTIVDTDFNEIKGFDIRDTKGCKISGRKKAVFTDHRSILNDESIKKPNRSLSLKEQRKAFILGTRSQSLDSATMKTSEMDDMKKLEPLPEDNVVTLPNEIKEDMLENNTMENTVENDESEEDDKMVDELHLENTKISNVLDENENVDGISHQEKIDKTEGRYEAKEKQELCFQEKQTAKKERSLEKPGNKSHHVRKRIAAVKTIDMKHLIDVILMDEPNTTCETNIEHDVRDDKRECPYKETPV
ncbi:5'-AMP-activated serine/threonine-protein kinase catalytic subunit alpha-like isoform X1 [Hydractinia symbiolongicarpus]|uniref:5'-AMP-activated serine/threonine-protein kinase catalytic subunit alpha-like isoform X1 n=1 Tax=Hydractinia symbiolongicarpus TaxID=13093 RepID=UPI00254AC7AE|nr:5'-AMP-activated serine/threonine-protein kinase catalytic subunit alpha-like isoform X1 [Hydractinia symbiolongicarpus]